MKIKLVFVFMALAMLCMPVFGQTTAIEWNNKGNALYAQGNYSGAIKCYDEAIRLDPNFADAWNGKGVALYAQGNYSGAIKCFDEAIRINRNYADAWYNKGVALKALGNSTASEAAFAKANELDYPG